MKIIFDRQKIINDVTPLLCAVSNRSTLRAVEGILIEAKEPSECVLTTYDTEKGVRIKVDAEVYEGGSYIINAQKFVQTLKVMPGREVTLTVSNNLSAVFTSGTSSHRTNAVNGSDFPELPKLRTNFGFTVSQHLIKDMINKGQHAMAVADPRPILNGAYFEITEGNILCVTCDSFRLSRCSEPAELENKNENKSAISFFFIIPVRTVNELYKLLDSDREKDLKMRIYMSRRQIVFEIGRVCFFSSLIEGQYIDYDRIVSVKHKINVKINREEMLEALERATLITEERIAGSVRSHVKLNFEGDYLKISAESSSGSTYDEIKIEHEGEDILIAFNNRYLIEALRACTAEEIQIKMTSPMSGIILEPTEEEKEKSNYTELFFVLPVRMK